MNSSWRKNYLRYKSYFLNVAGRYRERADLKAYLEIILSLLTVSIFSLFALRPTVLTIASLLQEIEAKRQTIAVMDQKIQQISTAQLLYDSQNQNIQVLEASIPDKPDPDVFVRQIEGISQKNQVKVTYLTTEGATLIGQAKRVTTVTAEKTPLPPASEGTTFRLRTETAIDQFTPLSFFLADLENLRQPAKIDTLTISTREDNENNTIALTVEGRLPYFTGIELVPAADEVSVPVAQPTEGVTQQ